MIDLTNPIYTNEDAAREHLESLQWPDGPVCPHCGSFENITALKGKSTRPGVYKCNNCRKPFSVTVGTLFERSHIPLTKWLLATHLLTASKKGMSAHQLHRMLGVTYKTAWFMAHRIRAALGSKRTYRRCKLLAVVAAFFCIFPILASVYANEYTFGLPEVWHIGVPKKEGRSPDNAMHIGISDIPKHIKRFGVFSDAIDPLLVHLHQMGRLGNFRRSAGLDVCVSVSNGSSRSVIWSYRVLFACIDMNTFNYGCSRANISNAYGHGNDELARIRRHSMVFMEADKFGAFYYQMRTVGPSRPSGGLFGGGGSPESGLIALAGKQERPKERDRASYSEPRLNFIQPNSLIGRFRHANLFAQIGFVVALGLATFGLIPVGFEWMTGCRGRRRLIGALFSVMGWSSLGVLFCLIFLAV